MTDQQQKIEVIRHMLQAKFVERKELKSRLENIQVEIKQVDAAITSFQHVYDRSC
jgi:hypothetical protein